MKLVPKLTFALFAGTSAILAVNGLLRVRREVAIYEADRARDRELLGRALASSADSIWRNEGRDVAIGAIHAAARPGDRLRVRWTPAPVPPADPSLRCAVVPIAAADPTRGALELCDPVDAERRFVRRTILDTIEATTALAVVSALIAMALSSYLVGRPVQALVDKARRLGRGDFTGPVRLPGRDELAHLADEMNVTADRLSAAHDQIVDETRRRIAALEALRHADRLATIGKLASGIAHELGTPLNVVSARATLIATGDAAGDEATESANVIIEASNRMATIIRQLLEFARRKGPTKALRDVRRLVVDTLELLRPIAQKRGVRLVLEDGAAVFADVDTGQLQQAVTNLVMNAIQALPKGGPVTVSIDGVRAKPPDGDGEERDHVRIRVHDQGVGIAPDVLPRIFEPFFTTKDVGEGTGLGLSVTYGIVRDHGGWIDATSDERGTTFTVHVPAGEPR